MNFTTQQQSIITKHFEELYSHAHFDEEEGPSAAEIVNLVCLAIKQSNINTSPTPRRSKNGYSCVHSILKDTSEAAEQAISDIGPVTLTKPDTTTIKPALLKAINSIPDQHTFFTTYTTYKKAAQAIQQVKNFKGFTFAGYLWKCLTKEQQEIINNYAKTETHPSPPSKTTNTDKTRDNGHNTIKIISRIVSLLPDTHPQKITYTTFTQKYPEINHTDNRKFGVSIWRLLKHLKLNTQIQKWNSYTLPKEKTSRDTLITTHPQYFHQFNTALDTIIQHKPDTKFLFQ